MLLYFLTRLTSPDSSEKVWIGDIVDPAPLAGSAPATISITWADDPCDVEVSYRSRYVPLHVDSFSCASTIPCRALSNIHSMNIRSVCRRASGWAIVFSEYR